MPQSQTSAKALSRAEQFRNRRNSGQHSLTLPSGVEIIVRKVPMLDIMRHKDLPHPIANIVNNLIGDAARARVQNKTLPIDEKAVAAQFTAKVLEDPMTNIEAIGNVSLMLAGVDPVFVGGDIAQIPPDAVHVSEVDLADKVFVWNWMSGTDGDAESFRDQQAESVAGAPDR